MSESSFALIVFFSSALFPLYSFARCSRSLCDSPFISSFSVDPATEDVDDGHKVAGELFVGRQYRMVENDETCPRSNDEPFDELDSEPRQSIFMGNHNFFDMAIFEFDQKPREPCSLELLGLLWRPMTLLGLLGFYGGYWYDLYVCI